MSVSAKWKVGIMVGIAGVAIMVAAPVVKGAEAGVQLASPVFCTGDICCDNLNCGSECHATVQGWNFHDVWCDKIEPEFKMRRLGYAIEINRR